ncbi:MAG: efflux transporter outer membrane subunit [Pirellulaceae bacterium]
MKILTPALVARLSIAAIALTLLVGCTTSLERWKNNCFKVGPEYCRPDAPLEIEWIDMQVDPRLSAEYPDIATWWYQLNDPLLNSLIEETLQQNLTLRQAGTRIQQAQAIRNIATGNLFPQVQQATADYQRIQTSENVAVPSPVGAFDFYGAGLAAAWELDFWGRFRRSVASADAALNASIASYDDVTVILVSSVAATYVEIRLVQERLRLARQNLASQQGSLEIAEARFQAQQTNKLDVNEAGSNVANTASFIPPLEAQLRVANNRLCVLLGIPPRDLVSQWPESPIPTVSPDVHVGIPADLLRRRPDIRVAERLMAAQSERIGIAEADLYPRISLIGSIEWQSESSRNLFDSASIFGLIGPSLTWNILNYGRIFNNVRREQFLFEESVYNYQETVLVAQQETEDAIIGFLKAQEQSDRLSDAVAEADEAAEIAVTLYRTGAIDFNRVFVIQSVQFAQQEGLVLSQANEVFNLIQIYRALGGGWESRCFGGLQAAPVAFVDDQSGGLIEEAPQEPLMDVDEAAGTDQN